MNHQSVYSLDASPPERPNDATETQLQCAPELLGAVDIVEAFTALRHELKLQVRGGRELQQTLGESLQRIEERIAEQPKLAGSAIGADDSRELAFAVAEIEESLNRAVEAFARQAPAATTHESQLDRFDRALMRSAWSARKIAGKLLAELRLLVEHTSGEFQSMRETQSLTQRGLELLLSRVRRLMQQCEIERVDVLRLAFDAETMHAVDVIDAPNVPSSHVAEQLRPAYLWRGGVLRCADVRLAK